MNEEAGALLGVCSSINCRDERDVSGRWPKSLFHQKSVWYGPTSPWGHVVQTVHGTATPSQGSRTVPSGTRLMLQDIYVTQRCCFIKWHTPYMQQRSERKSSSFQSWFFFFFLYSGISKNICSLRYCIGCSCNTKTKPGLGSPLQFWDLPHYYLTSQGQFVGKVPKNYKFRLQSETRPENVIFPCLENSQS